MRVPQSKIIFASAGIFLALLSYAANRDAEKALLLGILFSAFGWFGPSLYTERLRAFRKKQAVRGLAQVLELLRLQVGAGHNLELSLKNSARYLTGIWGEELARASFEIDRGVPFEESMSNIAQRFDSEDLNRFVLAIRQAKKLGASLSETLKIQAEALRTRRRQRAEEAARSAAVKISIPLVFFIFPALLIIYLAPAVLRIMQIF